VTNLTWTISKTKKRLYNEGLFQTVLALGFLSLSFTLFVALKLSIEQPERGLVEMRMPVAFIPKEDLRLRKDLTLTQAHIQKKNPLVVLTPSGDMYFGTVAAFTDQYARDGNKYLVRQEDGVPQAGNLLSALKQYKTVMGYEGDHLLLLPASSVPMNIVIQLSHMIQNSGDFKHVVLAHGLL
jgi:hypothetical protein